MRLAAPSLLSADFLSLGSEVEFLNSSADLIHIDVMDGVFVPNISFGFPVMDAVAAVSKIPLDVHLMIVHPERYAERFASSGASMVSFHLEACQDAGVSPLEIIGTLHAKGVKGGIAIDPDVPVEDLFPFIGEADYFLVMSVFAGFGGQKFIEKTFDRVRTLHEEIHARGLSTPIEVDGGVGAQNADALADAGVEIFVAGSAVFKASDRRAVIQAIRGERSL